MFNINIEELKKSSNTNSGYFQQTPFWSQFKSCHGWKYSRYRISWQFLPISDNENKDCHHANSLEKGLSKTDVSTNEVSVLLRSFAKNMFSIAYIPLFPSLPFKCTSEEKINSALDSEGDSIIDETIVTPETQTIEFANLINEIAKKLKDYLPKNTIFIRFDPAVEFSSPEQRNDFNYGLNIVSFADKLKIRKNKVDIQPPDSTQINLCNSEEEILNNMKTKWRYNIHLAERKGVEIEKILGNNSKLDEKLAIFYNLYKITAERDGIAIHEKNYYRDLLTKSSKEIEENKDVPLISLYLAKNENDYLGAIITLFSKTESIYLYGCSSNLKRNLMPNFLLQWTAMKDAKEYGSKYYDMYGMPPTDDENHPMHGLYLFKTGFGGKNIHRIGTFDVPLSILYMPCSFAENIRAFWHKKFLKKIRGR